MSATILVLGAFILLWAQIPSSAESAFDEGRAFADLRALVEIGPRPSGSEGSVRAQEFIMDKLARSGLQVKEQSFVAHTPLGPKEMKNIIGIVPGQSNEILLIGTHYETKFFSGMRFVGANDGTSGTAVLLELARCLQGRKYPLTIWLVFFDGEEAFVKWSGGDGLYGSTYMVECLKNSGEISRMKAVLILDMIGDAHLSIESEMNSTDWLRAAVWSTAKTLGYNEQFSTNAIRIADDHIPFLKEGIPALDIIDFHYGPDSRTNEYWHTEQDDLAHVSPQSLKIVGEVVLESIPEITARILRE
jgi:Zn-dependent M28 family amino/carboxypeptidase